MPSKDWNPKGDGVRGYVPPKPRTKVIPPDKTGEKGYVPPPPPPRGKNTKKKS